MDLRDPDHRHRLVLAALVIGSVLLYLPTTAFDFVGFDDDTVLLAHPGLYDETSFAASLHEIFVGYFPREEPLLIRDVSWALDARIHGFENPFGYHLGNVLLNALNVGLLFLFLLRATRRLDFAATVAALFAVLPVHVEPVSWVMGRKDVLSACFVLAALLAQQSQLRSPAPTARRTWYGLGLLFTGLAILSKLGAISCVLLLGLHRIFHEDLSGDRPRTAPFAWRSAVRSVLPGLIPHAALTVAVTLWFTGIVADYGVTGWRGVGPTDPAHLLNVARFTPLVWAGYLRQILFPHEPSVYYRWPHVEIPLTPLEWVLSAAFAIGFAVAAFHACRRRRDLAFYLLGFAALLAPYLSIVYVGFWSADRYVYLASFCVLAVVISLALETRDRLRPDLRLAIVVVLAAFGISSTLYTIQHQGVWRDEEALWGYEAYRSAPSLLSIQALAKIHVSRAEHETDPAARAEHVRAARAEIARGFEREQALGRVPAPYATSEQLQLGKLHDLLARLEAVTGGSVEARIAHLERSHQTAPTRSNTLRLAGAYYDLAQSRSGLEQQALVRRSFDYFAEHIGYTRRDPKLRAQSLALLTHNYENRFPYLAQRIAATKESMLP